MILEMRVIKWHGDSFHVDTRVINVVMTYFLLQRISLFSIRLLTVFMNGAKNTKFILVVL
jgi:hypothetical protein